MTTNEEHIQAAMADRLAAREHERATLLEQRQQLRAAAEHHESRLRNLADSLHEDLVRIEVLFAERTEAAATGYPEPEPPLALLTNSELLQLLDWHVLVIHVQGIGQVRIAQAGIVPAGSPARRLSGDQR